MVGNVSVPSNDRRGDRSDIVGFADMAFDVGGTIAPNLILRGRVWGELFARSDSELAYGPVDDAVGLLGGIGAGADYYFMPLNLYVGATVGIAGIGVLESREDRNGDDELEAHWSRPGLALDLDVGKEWWLTGNWGIGVGLRFRYVNVAPAHIAAPTDGRLQSLQGGLHFSITYN